MSIVTDGFFRDPRVAAPAPPAPGVTKLSGLEIDVDKDWQGKGITNIKEVAETMRHGDLAFRDASIMKRLPAGVAGRYLQTRGLGFSPVWVDILGVRPERYIEPDTLIVPVPAVATPAVAAASAPPSSIATPTLTIFTPSVEAVATESWLLIENCEDAWDEFVATGVTSTADTTIRQIGLASARMAVADAAGVGRLATEALVTLNLSPYKFLRAWVRSSIALAAGDLDILLDDTAGCVSPLKELLIPSLVANTWTQITLDMGVTSGLTAVISIGVGMNVDKGVFDFWIDQVRAMEGGV